MLRSVVAVATGFVVIIALVLAAGAVLPATTDAFDAAGNVGSAPVLLLAFAYVALFATIGCYVAARLAPDRPMRHALILGAVGIVFNVVVALAAPGTMPTWYVLVSLAAIVLWAWLGGRIREWELARRAPRPATPLGR